MLIYPPAGDSGRFGPGVPARTTLLHKFSAMVKRGTELERMVVVSAAKVHRS